MTTEVELPDRGASPDGDRAATASQPSPAVSGIAGIPSACRFYIDCEFDGHGGEMLSMALVREDGRGLYLCVADKPDLLDRWVESNVWPLIHLRLPVGRTVAFVEDWGHFIRSFIGPYGKPNIVADSPVDIWRFCETISTDSDGSWRSTDWSGLTFEVHNVDCYPTDLPGAVQHNAWWDAMALRHKLIARAIEARSGETRAAGLDPKDESAVAESDAPTQGSALTAEGERG